jgi:8-oxo-dGTP diphosphatase
MGKRERFKLDCSVFILLARDEQFCFLQRTGTGWKDGFYSVPAGALEPGETLVSAAIREAREEVGVELRANQLRLVHTMHCCTEGDEWLGHFFMAETWMGEARLLEPDKHSNLTWALPFEAPRPLLGYVQQALEAIMRNQRYSEFGWDDPKADEWDREITSDLQAGHFDEVIAEIQSDIEAGKIKP